MTDSSKTITIAPLKRKLSEKAVDWFNIVPYAYWDETNSCIGYKQGIEAIYCRFRKWFGKKKKENLHKVHRYFQTLNDGPIIAYEELKNIKEPTVVCLRRKYADYNGDYYDITRVLFPNGDCFYNHDHYDDDLTCMINDKGSKQKPRGWGYTVSCFSEYYPRSLVDTVDRMKYNDGDMYEIRKTFPYKGRHKDYPAYLNEAESDNYDD